MPAVCGMCAPSGPLVYYLRFSVERALRQTECKVIRVKMFEPTHTTPYTKFRRKSLRNHALELKNCVLHRTENQDAFFTSTLYPHFVQRRYRSLRENKTILRVFPSVGHVRQQWLFILSSPPSLCDVETLVHMQAPLKSVVYLRRHGSPPRLG